jgi:aminomethyltransferase
MSTLEAAPLSKTPLHAIHAAAGGRMVPFAGWSMPVQYVGVLPEVKIVREGAGLFDVSHMGRVRVRGADALAFLQYVAVSDVSRLPAAGGAAQYSLLCREAGGIIDDIIIYRLGPNEFIVVVNASNHGKDLSWIRHHATGFDVVIEDETEQTALIAVQGPRAVEMVNSLSDRDVSALSRFGVDESSVADIPAMIARTGYTGEDGFELFCPADRAGELWNALTAAGGVPCGLGARDTLRLEAALPLYGHEMDERVTPFDARLSWVVKLDKEVDFIGRGVLRELKAAPKRKALVGIEMNDRAIPRDGYSLLAADGAVVGHVTSGTFSPMRAKGIAMACVQKAYSGVGAALDVVIRDARHGASVVALPFYKNV